MTKTKAEWFDNHVEVIGFRASDIRSALRSRFTGEAEKKLTARQLGLPNLRDIKQTVGKDNKQMIDILVAHNKELVRKQSRAGNWGWVISEKGIASKTSKGILTTDARGSRWE